MKGVTRTNEQNEKRFVSNLRSGKVNGASIIARDDNGGAWGSIN